MYTAEIFKIINGHNLSGHAYADDKKVYFHAKPMEVVQVLPRLLECIDDLRNCLSSNRLKLIPDKTEVIWLASSRRSHQIPSDDDTSMLLGSHRYL
jgi:hypothetical protein